MALAQQVRVVEERPRETEPEIAVLIPCRNEAATIARVVEDFRNALPEATVYVYDNASTDGTAQAAARAGAVVRFEPLPGKGNVVRRMFADVEADVYVMADGDDTYEAAAARRLVDALLTRQLDMVNGARRASCTEAYRPGHRFGNRLLTGLVGAVFGRRFDDMLSGYRVFSRRYVKSFPALAAGFEIETELTVHALELRMPTAEVVTAYGERPEGSTSKLRTLHDGVRILRAIATLVKEERPLQFFTLIFLGLSVAATALSVPLVAVYLETGLVPRLPTAVLVTGMMLLAFLSLLCGLILQTVTLGRREMKRMRYLEIPLSPASRAAPAPMPQAVTDAASPAGHPAGIRGLPSPALGGAEA